MGWVCAQVEVFNLSMCNHAWRLLRGRQVYHARQDCRVWKFPGVHRFNVDSILDQHDGRVRTHSRSDVGWDRGR